MSAFKTYADAVAKLRVPSGFFLMLAFAWLSRPTAASLAAGLPISAVGLLLRGWATGHVEKNISLAQSGPYRYVRNPLYLGTSLVAAGLAIASQRPALGVIFVAAFVLVYLPVIELEEQHLRSIFPEFAEYAKSVPALRPTFRYHPARRAYFRWGLYKRNREYQASLGFLAAAVFLVIKIVANHGT